MESNNQSISENFENFVVVQKKKKKTKKKSRHESNFQSNDCVTSSNSIWTARPGNAVFEPHNNDNPNNYDNRVNNDNPNNYDNRVNNDNFNVNNPKILV